MFVSLLMGFSSQQQHSHIQETTFTPVGLLYFLYSCCAYSYHFAVNGLVSRAPNILVPIPEMIEAIALDLVVHPIQSPLHEKLTAMRM